MNIDHIMNCLYSMASLAFINSPYEFDKIKVRYGKSEYTLYRHDAIVLKIVEKRLKGESK